MVEVVAGQVAAVEGEEMEVVAVEMEAVEAVADEAIALEGAPWRWQHQCREVAIN